MSLSALRYAFAFVLLTLEMGFAPLDADQYLGAYVNIHDGEQSEKQGDYLKSLAHFKTALAYLQKIHEIDPAWETNLVQSRIKDIQADIARVQPMATKQYKVTHEGPDIGGAYSSPPSVFFNDALQSQTAHDNWGALHQFELCLTILEIIHLEYPTWESASVEQKIKESQMQIDQTVKSILEEESKHSGLPVQ